MNITKNLATVLISLFTVIINLELGLCQSSTNFTLVRTGFSNTAGKSSSGNFLLKESALGVFTSGAASSGNFVLNGSLIITEVEDEDALADLLLPDEFFLKQNYPNPFNPETSIRFALPRASHVEITVYNTRGQMIRKLTSNEFAAGEHTVNWDGNDQFGREVASGVYVYRLRAGDFSQVKKMSLLR